MHVATLHPSKLYRYSERRWLERSLQLGEFRLRPAADYKQDESDLARYDDELVRVSASPGSSVTITIASTGQRIKPIGDVTYRSEVGTNYLTVCFSERWDERMFSEFSGADACLVIHNIEAFTERLHAAADVALPEWVGCDAPVIYGGRSPLGAVFSKPVQFIVQHEWRFAWCPPTPMQNIEPIIISIGSIADIAEIFDLPSAINS